MEDIDLDDPFIDPCFRSSSADLDLCLSAASIALPVQFSQDDDVGPPARKYTESGYSSNLTVSSQDHNYAAEKSIAKLLNESQIKEQNDMSISNTAIKIEVDTISASTERSRDSVSQKWNIESGTLVPLPEETERKIVLKNEDSDNYMEIKEEQTSSWEEEWKCFMERTKNDNKKPQCWICQKHFYGIGELKRHIVCHTGEKPFKCGTCFQAYANRANLLTHIKTVHKTDNPMWKCHHCAERFQTRAFCNQHMLKEHKDKLEKFECGHCDKVYYRRDLLSRHIGRAHREVDKLKCDACDYFCYLEDMLATHKMSHTGEKLFKCDHCSKGFRNKRNFEKHLQTHGLPEAQTFQTKITKSKSETQGLNREKRKCAAAAGHKMNLRKKKCN